MMMMARVVCDSRASTGDVDARVANNAEDDPRCITRSALMITKGRFLVRPLR
jgi:hypothetical protein